MPLKFWVKNATLLYLDIPEPVDIVNVFRRADQVVPVAEEAVKIKAKVFWLQLDIVNEEAARIARKPG